MTGLRVWSSRFWTGLGGGAGAEGEGLLGGALGAGALGALGEFPGPEPLGPGDPPAGPGAGLEDVGERVEAPPEPPAAEGVGPVRLGPEPADREPWFARAPAEATNRPSSCATSVPTGASRLIISTGVGGTSGPLVSWPSELRAPAPEPPTATMRDAASRRAGATSEERVPLRVFCAQVMNI